MSEPNDDNVQTLTEQNSKSAAMVTALKNALKQWDKKASQFPVGQVMDVYRVKGKHFVDPVALNLLQQIRADLKSQVVDDPDNDYLDVLSFLDVMLDKDDETYDYRSYLALPLLKLPGVNAPLSLLYSARERLDRDLVLLIVDAIKFDIDSLDNKSWLPDMKPDQSLVATRCKFALRALEPYVERLGISINPRAEQPIDEFNTLSDTLADGMSDAEKQTLLVSLIPVYTIHDEYLFLRVLQSFETTFSWVALQLKAAIEAFSQSGEVVLAHLAEAETYIKEAIVLFQLLTTMRQESFRTFRNYTEGASAIQSRSYKTVESLCRIPDEDRLDSIAYKSVPEVRNRLLNGSATLDDAYLHALSEQILSEDSLKAIRAVMKRFELHLKRWRQSHYGIAVLMLGESTGTGYTEGTPYLNSVRKIPVFNAPE